MCTGIGFLLSLMGTLVLFGGTNSKNIRTFAVLYVFGNIIGTCIFVFLFFSSCICVLFEHDDLFLSCLFFFSFIRFVVVIVVVIVNTTALCATGFLLGPQKQCVKMWQPTRRWSTSLYLIMIIVVFVVAIMRQNVFLVLFLLLVEIVIGCWYSLSYVPFGRKIVCSFFRALGIFAPCFYVYDSCAETCQSTSKSSNNVFAGSSAASASSTATTTNNLSATLFGGSSSSNNNHKNSNYNNNSSGSFFGGGGGASTTTTTTANKDTRSSFW